MSTDTDTVLDDINGTLEEWDSFDAMRWDGRATLPKLTRAEMEIAARMCADTGMDGYAAAAVIADVRAYDTGSPFAGLYNRARDAVHAETCTVCATGFYVPQPTAWIARPLPGYVEWEPSPVTGSRYAVMAVPLATTATFTGKLAPPGLDFAWHVYHRRDWPDWRRGALKCRICNPRGNPAPLCIDGRAYARRQKRRGRGR